MSVGTFVVIPGRVPNSTPRALRTSSPEVCPCQFARPRHRTFIPARQRGEALFKDRLPESLAQVRLRLLAIAGRDPPGSGEAQVHGHGRAAHETRRTSPPCLMVSGRPCLFAGDTQTSGTGCRERLERRAAPIHREFHPIEPPQFLRGPKQGQIILQCSHSWRKENV